jgi:hypothetical protein
MKAFNNPMYNHIYITFPNGNRISCMWGIGSYTENATGRYENFMKSETCEIKIMSAPEKLIKKIQKKYGDPTDSVIGYVTVTQWLEILNMLRRGK